MLDGVAVALPCEQRQVACERGQVAGGNLSNAALVQTPRGGLDAVQAFLDVAEEMHSGGDGQGLPRALGGGGETEFGVVFEAAEDDVVEELMEARGGERLDDGGAGVDVVLEVPAEQTGVVPGQAAGARLQEEARAFDRAE